MAAHCFKDRKICLHLKLVKEAILTFPKKHMLAQHLQSRPIKMRTPILYLESGSIGVMGSACFAAVLILLQQAINKGSV